VRINVVRALLPLIVAAAGELLCLQEALAVPPTISVWNGTSQRFGGLGAPQRWVNILGNISDLDGIQSASFQLNGGPVYPLSWGPDGRRLKKQGDFNVDLLARDLNSGTNSLVISAKDWNNEISSVTVSIDFTRGTVWPYDYTVGWSSGAALMDSSQVVDGKWMVYGGAVRIQEPGYDRLIAIGDTTWQDYEVTARFTVDAIDSTVEAFSPANGGPAVGFLMRWNGHTDTPAFLPPISQPLSGYLPYGMIGWHHWRTGYGDFSPNQWELMGNDLILRSTSTARDIVYGVPYYFRMRVKGNAGGAQYSFKIWAEGESEPVSWLMTAQEPSTSPSHGSVMLVAHHVFVSVGPVSVVPAGTLVPPTLVAPSNTATNLPLAQSLKWRKVATAGDYHVQVSTSPTFSGGMLVDDSAVPDTAYSIAGLSNATTYYWRVESKNVEGSSGYSGTWSFTTTLAVPQLLQPAAGAPAQPTSLSLRWNKVSGATTYGVQVGTDSTFAGGIFLNDQAVADSLRAVSGLQNGTRYFWRVRGANAGGNGAYSTPRSLTTIVGTPSLLSPAVNALGQPTSVTLMWNATRGATSYGVQLASDSTFSSGVLVDDPSLPDTSRVVSGLVNATRYFWRVRARNAEGTGPYAAARAFNVGVATPVLLAPTDQSGGIAATVDFRWRKVTGATAFRLQAGTDQSFASGIVRDTTVSDSTASLGGFSPATRYYWRVNASNTGGASAYTVAWSFVTQVGVPVPLSPANNGTGNPTTVTMTWTRIPGASTYWLQMGTDQTFASGLIKNDSTIADTARTVSGLGNGVTHFWHVSAKNGVGRSPFSSTWSFRTAGQLPSQVLLVAPEQLSSVGKDDALLKWRKSSPGVSRYWVELGFDSTFALSQRDTTVADTTKLFAGLKEYQWYWWKVRAANAEGWGAFSEVRKFQALPPNSLEGPAGFPTAFALRQNYPNPFNPSTMIEVDLPEASQLRLDVFNMLGELVGTLADDQRPAGTYRFKFNAAGLPSGVYLSRVTAGSFVATQKMILAK
jgi:hypothetical protein